MTIDLLAEREKIQRRMKRDHEINRLIDAVIHALKGRSDLEIREWGDEIEDRLRSQLKFDGTLDAAQWRRAIRARDRAIAVTAGKTHG
jgi:hypothetical protein